MLKRPCNYPTTCSFVPPIAPDGLFGRDRLPLLRPTPAPRASCEFRFQSIIMPAPTRLARRHNAPAKPPTPPAQARPPTSQHPDGLFGSHTSASRTHIPSRPRNNHQPSNPPAHPFPSFARTDFSGTTTGWTFPEGQEQQGTGFPYQRSSMPTTAGSSMVRETGMLNRSLAVLNSMRATRSRRRQMRRSTIVGQL